MISPKKMGIIEIDITNACVHSCSNCTRFCGHHEKPYFMDFDYFKKALDSLKDYEGQIGIMGGEPTLHPRLEEIIDYVRNERTGKSCNHSTGPITDMQFHIESAVNTNDNTNAVFLSSLSRGYYKYFEAINDTFAHQILNDHGSESVHQALLMSRKELGISDDEWMKKRDKCWIQNTWSASITPKGAFFCEVAGALDMLFRGPGGWELTKDWWKREPSEFGDQLQWCELCGACLDTPKRLAHDERDDVSPGMYDRLKSVNSPKVKAQKVIVREPSDFDEYKSDTYVTGSEYIQAGGGIRITSENKNLFPENISYVNDYKNIEKKREKAEWFFVSEKIGREDIEQFLISKIWNPGCLYIIDDDKCFFSIRARSIRDKSLEKINSIDDLIKLYPENKVIYLYRDDPLLFLLGGQSKNSRKKFDRREKRLLVYGAGVIGKEVIKKLDDAGYTDYEIVVTDAEKSGKIDGHTIHNLAEFREKSDNVVVVLATKYPLHDEMTEILEKNGFFNYCTLA